jgi:UDP-2,4-diacetamido-2,4,6-trideoxy-beta-L-altropyranose hydrolase
VSFISRCESTAIRERIESEGMEFVPVEASHPDPRDLDFTLGWLARHETADRFREDAWVVVDGYAFDAAYHLALRGRGSRVMVIDDIAHLPRYEAAVVLNQNIGADELDYDFHPTTRPLLGPRYALLRTEFMRWRDWQRTTREVTGRVLVTLGGSDPDNGTLLAMESLLRLAHRGFETVVVAGPSNPHLAELERAAVGAPAMRILTAVNDMAELMAEADLAVSGGGGTCWEMAFMGLPTVILILAPNQQRIAEGLGSMGVSITLGPVSEVSAPLLAEAVDELSLDVHRREMMTRAGRSLVDGYGASRVVAALRLAPMVR